MKQKATQSNKSFTLLELLVVITIIGILSSIVVVSLSGSTDSASIAKGKAYSQQVQALLGSEAVGVWNFDEGEGTTVYDISGHGNDGTFYGGTHYVDSAIEGYALSFDGVEDYVNCGNDSSLNITDAITIATWVKPNSYDIHYPIFVRKMDNYRLGLQGIDDGQVFFRLILNGVVKDKGSVSIVPINEWTYVVGVYDGSYMRIYINGQIDGTPSAQSGLIDITIQPLIIGAYDTAGHYCFDGLIDEVRIYAEALPSTEIQKQYVQGLEKLLANQAITQTEYDQRMEKFNQSLTSI
jgi:prepilin-type N-terminal cleavage/methylation domain-containing protein